jgi:hypothetical protein
LPSAQPAHANIAHTHNQKNQHACEAKTASPQPNSNQKTNQNQKPKKHKAPEKWHQKNPQPRKTRKTKEQSLLTCKWFNRKS